MNQGSVNNTTPKIVGAFVITTVIAIAIYTLVLNNKPDTTTTLITSPASTSDTSTVSTNTTTAANTTAANTTTVTPDATATTSANTYKDGTYQKTASYSVPHGGRNSISASVTLKDGVITNVVVSDNTDDRESQQYINGFESSLKSAVVGKKLGSTISSRIGGASLTTNAFLNVLDAITTQALS